MAANRVKFLYVTKVLMLIIIAQFIDLGFGELQPTECIFNEDITTTLFPNNRESIDDCHLRYYKYGKNLAPLPTFGRPAYLREFAHMAAVGWTKPDGTMLWNCGGSLIWENYVLTAAHCTADDDNVPPAVVRLGDINLYNATDDQFAQQLKIVEIIRHPEHRFNSRYHDLALLRLEKNVVLHDTVAPGCLWNDEEIPFPSMEATGWGATGFGKKSTPILLKVSLSVVKKTECNRYYRVGDRGLKQGLQSYHLCAGDIQMDTCPGDSGGPLQVKLLHNGKMTPFIVGVTSFGTICGQSIPGVYVKVSSYIPWIRSELAKRGEKIEERSFRPYACALRYVHLREYEDDVVLGNSNNVESIDSDRAHMNIINSTQTVEIHWPAGQKGPNGCYGVIIDEDTVLTLARCALLGKTRASHIVHYDKRNDVTQVFSHPMHASGSFYNDIAVLKTKSRFNFTHEFVPACIWSAFELPDPQFYVTGHGRLDLNEFNYFSEAVKKFKPEIVQLSPRANIQSADNCTIPEEYLPALSRGLTHEHLCFGNKPFLVPESCQLQIGAPIRRNIFRMERHFEHITGEIEPARAAKELDDCANRYKAFHKSFRYKTEIINQFFHTVYIGWQAGDKTNWLCTGTLIARNLLVTSAGCLMKGDTPPTVVNVGEGNPNAVKSNVKIAKIDACFAHPDFKPNTLEHDIALVRLQQNIVPTARKYPICLWQNETHTPFLLHRMVKQGRKVVFEENYPKYTSDCVESLKESKGRTANSFELCTDIDRKGLVGTSGDPLVWYGPSKTDNTSTQYLVGIVMYENTERQLGLNTRISSYINWIKSLM